MKKAVIMVLCLALLAVLSGCQKTGFITSGDYYYYLSESGKAVIESYHGSETALTLPTQLDGHSITGIKGYSFWDTSFGSVVSLQIPEGYTEIDSYAFQNGLRLETLKLPGTLKCIGSCAFNGTQNLRHVELPEGLTTLDDLAFRNSALESIHIPDTVTEFGDNPFAGCKQLRDISLSDQHPALRWTGGVLTDREGTVLLVYPASRSDTRYYVPEEILDIAPYAFAGSPLRAAVLPEKLKVIENGLFEGCEALGDIAIPSGVARIGYRSFSGCTSLQSIELPSGVEEIGYDAFSGCTALEAAVLPSSVARIDYRAFSRCTLLQKIELPFGVEEIGNDAFSGCTALEAVVLPASVMTFGDHIFAGCETLTLIVPAGSAAEQYAKENKLPYRYSASDTQTEETTGGTPVPTNTASANQTQMPSATPQPSATLDLPTFTAKDFSWPVPAAGERLYIGEAKVSQAKRMYLAFIVSADGREVRDLTIHSEDVNIQYNDNGTAMRLTAEALTTRANKALPIDQTAMDIYLDEIQIKQMVIAGDTASCTLAYVYEYTDPDTGFPVSLPFDVATVTLQNYYIAASPAAKPTIQPPSAAEMKADGFNLPVPVGGERLYIGGADVSQAKKLHIAFIASADGTEMHDLTIYLTDLKIKIESGSTVTKVTGGSVTERYQGIFAVSGNAFAINLGRTQITDFTMTGDTASCVLAYVYHYSGSIGSGVPSTDVPFDVATVAFQRQ
ncbi:MAG: leucine-rich repeat domain-containing protein [Clostridiales bacterium]|nr:leucine-rich repeat domain-containing protein [Clostridiales bacterium]